MKLESYFDGMSSICREERQYALFLYNKLLGCVGMKCNDEFVLRYFDFLENCEIIHIGYEATYMRDFFYEDRTHRLVRAYGDRWNWDTELKPTDAQVKYRLKDSLISNARITSNDCESFNYKLCKYIGLSDSNICKVYLNRDLGTNLFDCDDDKIRNIIKQMMNAKPDLSIYYRNPDGQLCLTFLECKYVSNESNYGDDKQTDIQDKICEFLCRYVFDESITPITSKKKIVGFRGNRNRMSTAELQNRNEVNIDVSELIPDNI